MEEMVTIPKKEYERLKKIEEDELIASLERSMDDFEKGRVIRVR